MKFSVGWLDGGRKLIGGPGIIHENGKVRKYPG
jgi:hypothetical protein